jgi:hypothetical protein
MRQTKYKFMHEKEFENIKLMQKAGLTPNQVKKISDRSTGTLSCIWRAETFEDYKKLRSPRPKAEAVSKEIPVTFGANEFDQNIVQSLQGIADSLSVLDKRLTHIENGLVSKRKWL